MREPVLRIAFYFAVLTLAFGLSTGIAGIPVAFFLKDVLKLPPQKMAMYGALVSIPSYLGFLLGYVRDRWKPLGIGWGDRGFFVVAPPIAAGCYLYLASSALTYERLLAALLVAGVANGLIGIALGGFMAATARRHSMTGRLTSVFLFINMVPGILTAVAGGWLTTHFPPQRAFVLSATFSLSVMALGCWKPSFGAHDSDLSPDGEGEFAAALRELPGVRDQLRSVAFLCALAIEVLWVFCPGWGTPVFFQLTNKVGLTEQQYGNYSALTQGFLMVGTLVYAGLCRMTSLSRLLWVGTILGIIADPLFYLIHSPLQAYGIAMFVGFLLGMTNSAFMDLCLRSYLPGREGIAGALVAATTAISGVTSDLFGSWIYEKGGFGIALGVSAIFTTLILFVLPFVPKAVCQSKEGEQSQEVLRVVPAPSA